MFLVKWCFWINFWSTVRHMDVYSALLTARPNTDSLTPYLLTASHNKTFAVNLVFWINLTSFLAGWSSDFYLAVATHCLVHIHRFYREKFCVRSFDLALMMDCCSAVVLGALFCHAGLDHICIICPCQTLQTTKKDFYVIITDVKNNETHQISKKWIIYFHIMTITN
jgi:hypothetical protein